MSLSVAAMLRGAVKVRIQGAGAEAFFGMCARRGLILRDIRRTSSDTYTVWTAAGQYRDLARAGRISACTVRILEKRGAPFSARRLLRRSALWAGAVICALFVVFLSGRVWTIRVEGCCDTTQTEILELMRQAGVKTGSKRANISRTAVRNHVISNCDKLSYFTLNFIGTNAVAHVWEREETPEKLAEDVPCDVISELSGVVLALRVKTGRAEVKTGDTITAGTRIASGTVTGALGETARVHASAEAVLRTWYTISTAVPAEVLTVASTERMNVRQSLVFGEQRIPLQSIENVRETWYDKRVKRQSLRLREDFQFPIALESEIIRPCETHGEAVNEEDLSAALKQRMLLRLRAAKPDAEITGYSFSIRQAAEGAWLGVLQAELIETTGTSVPIG